MELCTHAVTLHACMFWLFPMAGELEQYERVVNCNVGVIEYTTNLQTAGDMIDAKRTHEASARQRRQKGAAIKRAKREHDDSVKKEALARVAEEKRRVT